MQAGIAPNGRPYQVIIAENSKFQSKQLTQILESEGYQVIATPENGKDLVKVYHDNKKVDLVTLDLNLPIMDGFAAFFELKAAGILPRVVIISEENTPAVIKYLMENGALDFIPKPIKREKVLEKINAAMTKVPKV